ncbi:uvrD-like Helicase, ATP-binding domain, P-loop containing nucleoside triphosphate hydrolase [Artemisia annua]|uniref:UvrD-like Helicase, ATP-binding domain, P-loop containing nucleoside triphosphate hydrolase n=1 Tax=Artemisia annua TaxID=35608 RepID=A0A2U1MHL7_ARTAN|nr:uvrD-like Helicase, ATP-binding domain, P-loop containing nucleoside triphosphate hydrolase [Artemisia annua]
MNELKVENIPLTFESEEHYFGSFVYPLLEETRCELASSMEIMYKSPFADILSINVSKGGENMLYDVTIGPWKNQYSECGKDLYHTILGDLLILVDGKPESITDLQHVGRTWTFSMVKNYEDDSRSMKVKTSKPIEFQDGMFVVFVINLSTQKRIWNSLHMHRNLNIIKEVLYSDSKVKECNICPFGYDSMVSQKLDPHLLVNLNESQTAAVMAALCKTQCCHISSVEQIWGPPGTGKTMTVSILLFILLQMKQRTLTCAPTNVAIVQLASRMLSLVRESFEITTASGDYLCSVGDVLLFGNMEKLKLSTEIEEICLDHRVKRLAECLGPVTGWKHCIRSMIDLLENCISEYYSFLENEFLKEKHLGNENEDKRTMLEIKSFIEFVQEQFNYFVPPLRRCIVTFCTHISRSFMGEDNFQNMISLIDNLSSLEIMLFQNNLVSEELEDLFNSKPLEDEFVKSCLSLLRTLQISLEGLALPFFSNLYAIKQFCFERASVIFCTTSSSYKLHAVSMDPLNIVVIDEAAQLKEAESTIPLQLPGMKHAILIGDERQLPAMVNSNVCVKSGFDRSLFDRLSLLGHSKHLLNVQYRMHPSICSFPNLNFYQNQIVDAQNVLSKSYEKRYLSGPMFGSYSFINVVDGREEKDDDGRSWRNMVEVAIVVKIVKKLYRAWQDLKNKITVGVISPYAAQVVSIQEKLAHKYENLDGFSVKVKSVEGFQGGEKDIIILSTVRSNKHGSVGFISSPQRTNVALTRARHCLWILGNERTLTNSESIWKGLVSDARNRHCLFDADADECLKMTIIAAKKELQQLDDLVNGNSVLFKHAKWKVLFSDFFRRSFGKLLGSRLKKLVLNLLLKLSGGWRPKTRSIDLFCENSSQILKQFKVEGVYVICSIDIIKEVKYSQILKVWDILPLEEIPKLTKRLESIFSAYTDAYINMCTEKCVEGNLEVPRSWPASQKLIKFRYLSDYEDNSEVSLNSGNARNYVENSKVSESLLLMKFYSLSRGVVSHLLSGKEGDLPMQATDEQMDIILSCKSSFLIGRSGTGKTTVLTMKLFQNEQKFRIASEGYYEGETSHFPGTEVVDDNQNSKMSVLRQLFVTVNPKLCYAVKQNVSHLTSVSSIGNSSADINLDDNDVITSEFNDIPDTLINIPVKSYPLVITFRKFLMMLDGTLGNSFFERFLAAGEGSLGNSVSSRSVALQTFLRSREVTFDRFCSLYWPHFNSNLTKKLDCSRVFTEIISHIKGGRQEGKCSGGRLSYGGYLLLAENRSSTITKEKRENVYRLFQAYEKMKSERGEFDLGDFVNDIHHRLKNGNYEGDLMDFVYIDEVQDLTMRQISLFKYICLNVEEGFIFAGDTAQTIARGVDFRFQDIRSLFYKEFLSTRTSGKQEKGLVSDMKQLKQNFRTHTGVVDLAQSVVDLLYNYFVHSIDSLEPETSLVSGEAPVLLECGDDENAIATIFGGNGSGGEIVGFGAEQVILVRDNHVKTEICENVGKQALVLTIMECKGLEFHDVLLYNFFGTSPLKEQWRVMYEYMKKHNWVDDKHPQPFPTFSEERHSLLCSELKQLYVAITRTRQRLWICENKEELSKPMFDYWKLRGLVQMRKLDDSVARAMRVTSSPQEWRERGKKLFYENNFAMATLCFERAGDTVWEKMAKASDLRASADQIRGTNHEAFRGYVREAAEMFESIGKLESAASCYCDLGEYERAGKIYLYTCGKVDAAAECFSLAGCYSEAAEAYAKGDQLSKCLLICKERKLFDKGLEYIKCRKECVNDQSKEIRKLEQEFLESCAFDYHEHEDHKSMMRFVQAFYCMESKRVFLRSLGCLDELLLLEEESGHFIEAAELARSLGDVIKEADLLEKVGHFKEAADLLLWYVYFSSLWGNGNSGWPLKQFPQKEVYCEKAKSLAKMDSDAFCDFVENELKVLCGHYNSLPELKNGLDVSQKNRSLRGEILLVRKILNKHLHLNYSKYEWEDELPIDIYEHCKDKMLQKRVSIRTLVFYWNLWRENVVNIFESLGSFHNEEPDKDKLYADFSLFYFGVRKHNVNGNMVYLLVNKDAEWVRKWGDNGLHMDRTHPTIDGRKLVYAIRSYWQSELVSVGIKVLETLDALRKSKSNSSPFRKSTCLLHIFEVSKFLLGCQSLNLTNPYIKKLQCFLGISLTYFDLVFPLDWRKSVSKALVSLRETDISIKLLNEIILHYVDMRGDFNYWTIGRVMMICLGSKTSVALYEHIINKLQWDPKWKSLVEKFRDGGLKELDVHLAFAHALNDTFTANWRLAGFISPDSFLHLLDRLLFVNSLLSQTFYTTKSSFVGWFTYHHSPTTPSKLMPDPKISPELKNFYVQIAQEILFNGQDAMSWIQRSDINLHYYLPILASRLIMILSLICLEESDCSKALLDLLLNGYNIACLLPDKLVSNLLRRRKGQCLNLTPWVVAEAFSSIEDPLLIVCSGDVSPKIHAPCAIFVDLWKSKEEIKSILFSKDDDCGTIDEATCYRTLHSNLCNVDPVDGDKRVRRFNCQVLKELAYFINERKNESLREISEFINGEYKESPNILSVKSLLKKEMEKNLHTFTTARKDGILRGGEDITELDSAFDKLNDLLQAFCASPEEVENSVIVDAMDWLKSPWPDTQEFQKRYVVHSEYQDAKNTKVNGNNNGKNNKGKRK